MKYLPYKHGMFILVFVFIGMSCNTVKTTSTSNNILFVTLGDKMNGEYLRNRYEDYNIVVVQKSNKTLNQYKTIFNCSTSRFLSLQEKMREDEKIVSLTDHKIDSEAIQSSKSIDNAKTKPIRKNN